VADPAARLGRAGIGKRKIANGGGCFHRLWLSIQWHLPLDRGLHIALAPVARSALCAKKALLRKAFSLAPHIPQGTFSCRYAAIHLGSLLAIKSQGLRPLTIRERLFRQAEAADVSAAVLPASGF